MKVKFLGRIEISSIYVQLTKILLKCAIERGQYLITS